MSFAEMQSRRLALKHKLRNRERLFGGWVSYPDPAITETFAKAGFDFIAIDMEHTTISLEQAKRIITSCHAEGTTCLPRPVSHNNDIIKPLLEVGADGLFIQMVETATDVRRLIDLLKFPPIGRRSYGVNRAHGYGFDFEPYIREWNASSSLILQVESITGVENIEELIAFDEVDGVMVGPYDISGSLGVPGQIDHPKVREGARRIIEACGRRGKSCCTQLQQVTSEAIDDVFAQGFSFVILSSDLFVLWRWAERMRDMIARSR